MYRTVVYFHPLYSKDSPNAKELEGEAIVLQSAPFQSLSEARALLAVLLARAGFCGGDIQQEVPGFGWCLLSEVDNVCHMMSDHLWAGRHGEA
jgi:hypothetical protein